MNNIVERLRKTSDDLAEWPLLDEAADEIGRLRTALQHIVDGADSGWSAIGIARRALGDET